MATLGTPHQLASIFSMYDQKCIPGFKRLCNVLKNLNGGVDQASKASLPLVIDQLGRLQVWAAHSGAHRAETSKLSLDYRLREASHMHSRISGFLAELDRDLHQGK